MIGTRMASGKILIVDDEELALHSTKTLLNSEGITDIVTLADSRDVLPFLKKTNIDVVVLDLLMPHISGEQLLHQIHEEFPDVLIIILSVVDDFQMGINCMKIGAFDYLLKPADPQHLVACVKRALNQQSLAYAASSVENQLQDSSENRDGIFSEIVTVSKKMLALFNYVRAIGASDQPVLIYGETGTGKKLFAAAVHKISDVPGPLVSVKVAGLDENIFSELLCESQAEKKEGHLGEVMQNGCGTLFLDEIGELSDSSQLKLLNFLKNDSLTVQRAKGRKAARIICSTNKDLRKMIQEGRFRRDLYYRLGSHKIDIPPLRERPEDIPLLVHHFIEKTAIVLKKMSPLPTPELFTLLSTYYFPGNVRELQAMVRDAVSLCQGTRLSMKSFEDNIGIERRSFAREEQEQNNDFVLVTDNHFPTLNEGGNLLIDEAMRRADNNQRVAAGLLGISRQALNRRLRTRKHSGKK
ncbi:MAG: sigma-54 dependent transcriptional regulator [Desulfobulbaceae bacterium]|nr:sigma-54 dependent transcriptional regulator [Desulfobulbaceae bacterium]